MKKVIVQRKNGFLWIRLNRPTCRNAIDYDVMNALEEILETERNGEESALIITGSESSFCAGGDLRVFHALKTEAQAYEMLAKMGRVLYKFMTFPKPTVAFMNGIAIGGGCEIATACDYRFAVPEAKLGFVQGDLAITTGWGGASMLLEKLPYDKAMQMLWSARRYTAEEAETIGFLNGVFENESSFCTEWLQDAFVQHAEVLTAYKRVAIRKWQESNLAERMQQEIRECAVLWEGESHHRAVETFLKK
ncbi:enoyl-CoA hydratase/isomerase family protein [Ectobacillus antri]|jgi:enoyl-CoA hydratase|uniref:Ethylmalonyl-CoA decarboxylase n=1 Tax=Ectobacillus antri TaxID=2486280 RepID=A0ABT6H186_9BACI|nr:enoyl-CoA hydratase/isomerase family protein [Ectobacillus antri]MDG4655823.1 enoyl-CoA hydratase/isomerase family protein [Ectobacillus antri]MDG5752498.1 enoyl-CoA hydratase/isomerase family protein [Ectobacillus antri]